MAVQLNGFDIYLVNVKTIRQISQIFVAFSEKLNFKKKIFVLIVHVNYDSKG